MVVLCLETQRGASFGVVGLKMFDHMICDATGGKNKTHIYCQTNMLPVSPATTGLHSQEDHSPSPSLAHAKRQRQNKRTSANSAFSWWIKLSGHSCHNILGSERTLPVFGVPCVCCV